MVTKGYQKGVYDRVTKGTGDQQHGIGDPQCARAIAVSRKIDNRSTAGLGSFRKTFHTTMVIDSILRCERISEWVRETQPD